MNKKFYVRRNTSYYKIPIWNKKTISKDPKTNLERKGNTYGKDDIHIKMSHTV